MEELCPKQEEAAKLDFSDLLQCCSCKKPLKTPQTLQQCLHSYCKTCLQNIPKTEQDGKQGWICEVCKSFTGEDNLRDNDFIQDLMDHLHTTEEEIGKSVACKSCERKENVVNKCMDCKIELCDICQKSHLKIPGLKHHKITEISQDDAKVVDKVIYCKLHPNKPIEYNCITCNSPTCGPCNWTIHKHHDIETVSEALDRTVSELRQMLLKLSQN